MKKRKLLALCLVPALLAGCAAPAGVTDLSRQFEAGDPAPPEADPAVDAAIGTLGAELLRRGLKAAEAWLGKGPLRIEAQTYAKGFYEKFGFRQVSEEFLEDGIPHIQMLRE